VETLRAAVKDLLIPGSLAFLLVGQLSGVLLLFGGVRAALWGRRWMLALVCIYFALSLQGTSDLLVFGLTRGYHPVRSARDADGANLVVLLGNGAERVALPDGAIDILMVESAYNVLEAARLYRLLGNPTVLISGAGARQHAFENTAMAAALTGLGVPAGRIVLDDASPNTLSQGVNVSAWMRAHQLADCLLVTSPEHMRRAAGVLSANGIRIIPSVSGVDYGGTPAWRPTFYALTGSKNAIYEYLALCLYRFRGWI
jgi:uncharacterized SAM-binding protein YcdF (DUF218 family)